MKKKVLRFVLLLGIMMSLSSCLFLLTTTKNRKMVVDENTPADQNAVVKFTSGFYIREWNNNDITDDLYDDEKATLSVELTVPAGDNSFTFDVAYSVNNATYRIKNIELKYNLEPGKKYRIGSRTESMGFGKGAQLFVNIYDDKKNTLLKEWKVGEAR